MTTARDINLHEWLTGIGFHPADTEVKQLGHEAARQLIARLGETLHDLLPPGRDKSLVFTALEDALMRANRALAIGGGPDPSFWDPDSLRTLTEQWGSQRLPEDQRIAQYKATQVTEPAHTEPAADTSVILETLLATGDVPAEETGARPTEPVETFRASWRNGAVSVDVTGGAGYVQLGVICNDVDQAREAQRDAEDGVTRGFYTTMENLDDVNAVLDAITGAATTVWADRVGKP